MLYINTKILQNYFINKKINKKMSKMKMIMLVNTTNENLCEFLPNDAPQKLINELHDVSNSLKNIPSQGCIQTTQNKFFYRQFNPEKKIISSKEEDVLVLFACTDIKYKDNMVSKFFDEAFNALTLKSYSNFKLVPEAKTKIAKVFYKYQSQDNINKEILDLENNNLEFGTINEFTSLDIDTKKRTHSVSMYGLMDSIDEKDLKKDSKGNGEVRVPIEVTKIRKWRTLKCIFLFINLIMIGLTVLLFFYFLGQPEKE